jgi:hypothetical protein
VIAVLRYTVLRLLVFLGCLALLWLVGLRGEEDLLLLVVGAALLSAVISYVALRRFREEYSAQLATRIEQRTAAKRGRPATSPSDEDAEDAETSRDDGTFR